MSMITDSIADMLTRLRNAQMRRKRVTQVLFSKMNEGILKVLLDEGYVKGYKTLEEKTGKKYIEVALKYHNDRPVIRKIKRESKPSRRQYNSVKDIPVSQSGLGLVILTTNRGVVSGATAAELGVGGEVLCSVF